MMMIEITSLEGVGAVKKSDVDVGHDTAGNFAIDRFWSVILVGQIALRRPNR